MGGNPVTGQQKRFGLSAALTTPFQADGAVDRARLAVQARWCLDQGCASVTAFGTTGEGASIEMASRKDMLAALKGAGLDFRTQVVGGVAASTIPDAIEQTRLLTDAGCRAVLLAPPFYFKGVSDDGLFDWFSSLLTQLGDDARDIILYNIPSVTALALSVELIGRLRTAFPKAITGVKDSSGDWAYTQKLLAAHKDIAILIGDERSLAEGVRLGAQGAISGMANICPDRLLPMVEAGQHQESIVSIVQEVLKYPVTPAVKALVAHRTGDDAWLNVRVPLRAMSTADARALGARYDTVLANKAA